MTRCGASVPMSSRTFQKPSACFRQYREIVAVLRLLLILLVGKRGRPCQPAQLAAGGDVADPRFPEKLVLAERHGRARAQPRLPRCWLRHQSDGVISEELQKGVTNPLFSCRFCEGALGLRECLEGWSRLVLSSNRRRDQQCRNQAGQQVPHERNMPRDPGRFGADRMACRRS